MPSASSGASADPVSDYQPTARTGSFRRRNSGNGKRRSRLDATISLWIILHK
jgi:hypothetical protein